MLCFLAFARAASDDEKEEKLPRSSPTQSQQNPKIVYPAFQVIRSEEDWSALLDSGREAGYEKLKFIPLNSSGSFYLSVGGQLRLRGESWSDFGFGGPGTRDDSFGLSRFRLHADLWLGPRARIFVEGKSALAAGRRLPGGFRTLDVDSVDLQNAHLDVRVANEATKLTFRVGRQELLFGKQRLVSPLDWSNTRRAFDGVRAIVGRGSWRVDGFFSKFADVKKYSFNRGDESGVDLYGIYASGAGGGATKLDLYWLGLEKDRAVWQGAAAEEKRQTFGARVSGAGGAGWDWEMESAFQTGDHGRRDIRAFMWTGEAGYTWSKATGRPRLSAGVDFATGDSDPTDGQVNTFNQILPLGHAYLGIADFVGRQNVVDWRQEFRFAPWPGWSFSGGSHFFWRARTEDALYNAGGGIVRPGAAGNSRRVGWEGDLTAGYAFNRYLRLDGGYSHFAPGPFLKESGPSESMDFLYLAVQTTF